VGAGLVIPEQLTLELHASPVKHVRVPSLWDLGDGLVWPRKDGEHLGVVQRADRRALRPEPLVAGRVQRPVRRSTDKAASTVGSFQGLRLLDLPGGRGQPVHPRLGDDVVARQRDRAPQEVRCPSGTMSASERYSLGAVACARPPGCTTARAP
jgi:hypothetical protein